MGYYINETSDGQKLGIDYISKIEGLKSDGATPVSDNQFIDNMVCVVDNGAFAAAAYAFCEGEYEVFKEYDGRPKTWLQYPHAKKLSGYEK